MSIDRKTGEIVGYVGFPPGKAFYAQLGQVRAKVDHDVLLQVAERNVRRRLERSKKTAWPKVRVFRAKTGRQSYVLRVGDRYVRSWTWDGLVKKAAWGPWLRFMTSDLKKRWL
jgi:hypothetical protein